jgi:ATP-binding protein involved in chromosome partitioning
MDKGAVREILQEARGSTNEALISADDLGEIIFEDGWFAVHLSSAAAPMLKQLHAILSAAFPDAEIELRSGQSVFRGGEGLGPGKRVIAVMGGKGGVGKSTLALNLALTFSAMGMKTGIIDGDFAGSDIPHLLGVHPMQFPRGSGWTLASTSMVPRSKRPVPPVRYSVGAMSIGFTMPERQWVHIAGDNFASMLLRYMLYEVQWEADLLIIDAPPGTGTEVQVMARQLPLSGVLFVTTPQDLAQLDASRTVTLLEENDVPVIGMVFNMASLACPHCSEEIDLYTESRRLQEDGVEVLARIPFDVRLSRTADQGLPLVLGDPTGHMAYKFAEIGARVRRWLREHPAPG